MAVSAATTNARREKVRTLLAARAGIAGDANALAQAAIDTWREVTTQLVPVIGAGGVEVLFNRAVHQAANSFPWLATTAIDDGHAPSLATLRVRFAGQSTAAVEEASATVLVNFADMLATLIGESLTESLLNPVWPGAAERLNGRTHDE